MVLSACVAMDWASRIRNDAYFVRYYWRNRTRREQALLKLGLTCREALTQSKDTREVILAMIDGLKSKDDSTF